MRIDCDTCAVRDIGCGDCVVPVLLAGPPDGELDESEERALEMLARAGLIPPLRMTHDPVRRIRPELTTRRGDSTASRRRSA